MEPSAFGIKHSAQVYARTTQCWKVSCWPLQCDGTGYRCLFHVAKRSKHDSLWRTNTLNRGELWNVVTVQPLMGGSLGKTSAKRLKLRSLRPLGLVPLQPALVIACPVRQLPTMMTFSTAQRSGSLLSVSLCVPRPPDPTNRLAVSATISSQHHLTCATQRTPRFSSSSSPSSSILSLVRISHDAVQVKAKQTRVYATYNSPKRYER